MSLKKCVECVKKHKFFLITSHTSPEGDALGSELALLSLLKKLNKVGVIYNADKFPPEYGFLPGKERINIFKKSAYPIKFDCMAVVDSSDLGRIGEVYKLNLISGKPILNIDHHISNKKFGDVNWVEPYASSCAEMIYRLYKALNVHPDKETALALYVGILTDTGSFHYANTSSFTHRVVAELLKYNLNTVQIYKNIYENIPFKDLQYLAKVLRLIKLGGQGKIAWLKLPASALKIQGLSFDLSEHILSFCRAIRGIEVVAIFKENLGAKNEIRVNFRSQGKADVNKIARQFGGGGHKTASGATIKGDIDNVVKRVLAKIKEELAVKGADPNMSGTVP